MTVDLQTVERVAALELLAKSAVDGFLSGRHRSRFHGASLEFAQHREYVPGDDLRHLDWKVWARADRLTVKQYEAETNVTAVFALDASDSMAYGDGASNKFECARRITAALAYLLLNQSDAVGAVFLDGAASEVVPARTGRTQFHALTRALVGASPQGKTDLAARVRDWGGRAEARGLRILVSDLYGDPAALAAGVAALRRRGHDVIVLQVLHRDEMDLPFDRFTRFVGMEDPGRLACDPKSLQSEYRALIGAHCSELQRRFSALGVTYRGVLTDQPLGEALAALLLERSRT